MPVLLVLSCSSAKKNAAGSHTIDEEETAEAITFDADSAYNFAQAQCNFGPRVPNSDAHRRCGDFLVAKLKGYGAEVIEQHCALTAFDGTHLNARNIIAEFYPDSAKRILLLAHWDCRPWADNDRAKCHPYYGGMRVVSGNYSNNINRANRAYECIYQSPKFRRLMARRLRTLMDDLLKEPGTAQADTPFWNDYAAKLVEAMQADDVLDRQKWGLGTSGQLYV